MLSDWQLGTELLRSALYGIEQVRHKGVSSAQLARTCAGLDRPAAMLEPIEVIAARDEAWQQYRTGWPARIHFAQPPQSAAARTVSVLSDRYWRYKLRHLQVELRRQMPAGYSPPLGRYKLREVQAKLWLERGLDTCQEPVLERLADAGAIIDISSSEYTDEAVAIHFEDAVIDEKIAADLGRLLDSDSSAGPPVPLDAFAAAGAGIRMSLSFVRCRVGRRELALLNGAKRLSVLLLNSTPVDDAAFADVKTMPRVREFWVADSADVDIGDEGLRFLETSRQLKKLFTVHTRLGDPTLARIQGAREMEVLVLDRSQVTDEGLRTVGEFPKLRGLDVSECDVTDAGLAHLAGLASLAWLDLGGTKITDAGLARLPALASLTSLNLNGTNITDAGLGHVADLPNLTLLNLAGTRISDAGLQRLAALAKLTALDLSGTNIADAGVVQLTGLHLQSLFLRDTNASDACLKYLAEMPLTRLDTGGTRITKEGMAKMLPHLIWNK